jgi:signal transduction histidine kinase
LLFAVFGGGLRLWQSVQSYRQHVLPAQREATLVLNASVELKSQVQEWKNILLRTEDEASFVRLVKNFDEREAVVRAQIALMKKAITDPEESKLLTLFEENYAHLTAQYRIALAGFRADDFDHRKADLKVRGLDRPATDLLDKISDHADDRAKKIEASAEAQSDASFYWALGGIVLGLGGSAIGFFVLARRVVLLPTKQAFHDLKMATEQLNQAERMAALGGLVAGVAHEINTPVGISLTCATTLQDATKTIQAKMQEGAIRKQDMVTYLESARECSELMTANAYRAANLIQSFKQIAVDQTSEERRTFELNAYIHEILASLHPQFKRTAIKIEVNCSNEIELDSYPGAFAQVITNLLMNAVHHAFDDEGHGTIHIDVNEQDKSITLLFKDNGRGIPVENLSKIFDPFFTTRRNRGGTGLGMNIVYNIVTTTLGGSISVDSTIGLGTTFTLSMPREAPLMRHAAENS